MLHDGPVEVRVPATSANLGPGFDSLGLALDLHDRVVAEVAPSGLEVVVEGAGSEEVPRDERHLVVRGMRAAFARMGVEPPGLRLHCHNAVPHSRGLGSSAAALVSALVAARGLVVDGEALLDDAGLLDLASDLEGHPDNVAPALLGGFVISGRDAGGRWYAVSSPVHPDVRAVVLVPGEGVSTEVARGLLPATVPHADAAANSGRTALLVAALAGRPELLEEATRDWLHQEQRAPAMPQTLGVVHALRAEGHAATVSGAGPTVLVLTTGDPAPVLARTPAGWTAHALVPDLGGCRLLRC